MFKAAKAIQDQGLARCCFRSKLLMKKEAMPPEAVGEASDSGVGDAGLSSDLSQTGARNESMEDGFEEVISAKPIVARKGL